MFACSLPAGTASLLITGCTGASHVSCAMGLCSGYKANVIQMKISSCSITPDQGPVSAVSGLPFVCQRGREKESPGRGSGASESLGSSVGGCAELGAHLPRRLLSCHRSPKSTEDAGEPGRAQSPWERPYQQPRQASSLPAGREGRREDGGWRLGSRVTSTNAAQR